MLRPEVTAVVVDRTLTAQVEANEEIGSEKRAEQKAFINDFVGVGRGNVYAPGSVFFVV